MKNCILFLSFLFLFSNTNAQAPNDDCNGAISLIPKNTGSNTDNLFQDLGLASNTATSVCNSTIYRDLWYSFVATNDTHIVYLNSHTSGLLPQIELNSGTCASLTSVGCYSGGVILLSNLQSGNTYYLRAFDFITAIKFDIAILNKPTNDECLSAFPLTVFRYDQPYVGELEFWNYAASASGVPCAGTGSVDEDVWFQFTATDSVHNLLLQGVSSYFYYEYFSGSCGSLTSKGCGGFLNTDHATLQNLTAGQQYFMRLYTQTNSGSGYIYKITLTTLPENDKCQGAITIPVSVSFADEQSVTGDLWFTTPSSGSCNNALNDAWYKFTANASTAFVKTQLNGDASISVYSGGCASLTNLICSDSVNTKITGLTSGSTYYLQLGSNQKTQNLYSIAVTPLINNDECSGAVVIQVDDQSYSPNAVEATLYSATQSMTPCAGTQAKDVWFKFTATKPNLAIQMTTPNVGLANTGFRYELFSGTCGALTSLKCDTVKDMEDALNNLVAGQDYYIRIYAVSNYISHFRIGIVNSYNECDGAQQLELTTSASTEDIQAFATINATVSMPACTGNSGKDVWFRFTATQSQHSYIISDGYPTQAYPVVQLFSGTCGSLTSLKCKGGLAHVFDNLTPGQQYYFRVYSSAQFAFSSFKIRVFQSPENDNISNATEIPVTNDAVIGFYNQVTSGATSQFGSFCSGSNPTVLEDVWYYFVAPLTAQYETKVALGINANHFRIEAFSQYNTTSAIQGSMISCGTLNMNIPVSGTINSGDTVWMRIYADTGSAGNYTGKFNLSVKPVGGATNDEPSEALELRFTNRYQYYYDPGNMTLSTVSGSCISLPGSPRDLWFRFTAGTLNSSIVSDELNTRGSFTELFSGSPGNLTSLGCSDNIYNLPSSLTPGQEYYIRVVHPSSGSGRIGYFFNDTLEKNNLVSINCLGQNLVPNPAAECFNCEQECPAGVFVTGTKLGGDDLTDNWFMATDGSVDYYNSCAEPYLGTGNAPSFRYGVSTDKFFINDIVPRSGKGYLGFFTYYADNYREYPQTQLTQPLVPGSKYLISFYVAKGASSSFSINQIGALLSCDQTIFTSNGASIGNWGLIPLVPQVMWNDSFFISHTNRWTNVSAIITADKPYRYLTIGNFASNEATLVSNPGVVDPSTFQNPYTSYMLLDDIVVAEVPAILDDSCAASVTSITQPMKSAQDFFVYPNPSDSRISWSRRGDKENVSIYNINGSLVLQSQITNQQLDISALHPGIYLIRVETGGKSYIAKFIRKE